MQIDTETTGFPGHESVVELDVDPPCIKISVWRSPREWWHDYRASLLTRSALSDTLTELERLRLSAELLAVTVVIGLGWTLWVFAVLVLAGIVFGFII